MATEGTWKVLDRSHRRYLAALNAPQTILVCEHDIDYRDFAGPGVDARCEDAYAAIRGATASVGLFDVGVPVGSRSRDTPRFVWNDEAEATITADLPQQLKRRHRTVTFGRHASLRVYADPERHDMCLVVSDWDGSFPRHVLVWGDERERVVLAVEAALAGYRERHPRHEEGAPGEQAPSS